MIKVVSSPPVATRIVVHVLCLDTERRVLLDWDQGPASPSWTLPTTLVAVGEDPVVRARQLVSQAGALAATRVEVIDLESLVEGETHLVHMVFECGAEPSHRRHGNRSSALWWSLPEIVGLNLSPRTRKALASRWSLLWPHT